MKPFRYAFLVPIFFILIIIARVREREVHTVNVTDVWFMNSGIIVWGYWDNSIEESNYGLFMSGFSDRDIGKSFKISFFEIPDPDIRCLKLIKKEAIK